MPLNGLLALARYKSAAGLTTSIPKQLSNLYALFHLSLAPRFSDPLVFVMDFTKDLINVLTPVTEKIGPVQECCGTIGLGIVN
jgi:hypothetical protein